MGFKKSSCLVYRGLAQYKGPRTTDVFLIAFLKWNAFIQSLQHRKYPSEKGTSCKTIRGALNIYPVTAPLDLIKFMCIHAKCKKGILAVFKS